MSEEEDIYAVWAADGLAWRAAQDAWAHWLDVLVEKRTANMASERPDREIGGKWLYGIWMDEMFGDLIPGSIPRPWETLDEDVRERFRKLWDTINKGFRAWLR